MANQLIFVKGVQQVDIASASVTVMSHTMDPRGHLGALLKVSWPCKEGKI